MADESKLAYRRDIDGLRAIAVLAVVFNHAGFSWFPGGFIGVDIFFVISGYLITTILVRENEAGEFSIFRFYDRRIRRIFPALFAMLAVVAIAACVLLLPSELMKFGRSLAATALFVSNIYFWSTSGYFDGDAGEHPLLHTWSLAVEEQFYIVWPLLLWAIFKLRLSRWLVPIVIVGIMVSLGLAASLLPTMGRTVFYMLPMRAWELLLGALLACAPALLATTRWRAEALAAAGLVMMLAPIFLYTHSTPFPGLAAAPPCIGACLVILAGRSGATAVGRVLASPPMVGVGLISYSLYLWHWPFFALHKAALGGPAPAQVATVFILLAVALAYLSWRFVERPFRRHSKVERPLAERPQPWRFDFGPTARVITGGVATTVIAVGVGAALLATKGLPSRLPAEALAFDQQRSTKYSGPGCAVGLKNPPDIRKACLGSLDGRARPAAALWGDSHARHFARAAHQMATDAGLDFVAVVRAGCIPLAGVESVKANGNREPACRTFSDEILKGLATHPNVKVVMISGYHDKYYLGEEDFLLRRVGDRLRRDTTLELLDQTLREQVDQLTSAGRRVILVAPTPQIGRVGPNCLAREAWTGQKSSLCISYRDQEIAKRAAIRNAMQSIAAVNPMVTVFDPLPNICRGPICDDRVGDRSIFNDTHHLSFAGSQRALEGFDLVLNSSAKNFAGGSMASP